MMSAATPRRLQKRSSDGNSDVDTWERLNAHVATKTCADVASLRLVQLEFEPPQFNWLGSVLRHLLRSLRYLDLSSVGMDDEACTSVFRGLEGGSVALTHLNLSGNVLTHSAGVTVAHYLAATSGARLETLLLGFNRLEAVGAAHVFKRLAAHPSIRTVDLGSNAISADGLPRHAGHPTSIRGTSSAVTARYGGGNAGFSIGGGGSGYSGSVEYVSLKQLYLHGNALGDGGLKRLFGGFLSSGQGRCFLEGLELSNCALGPESGGMLATAVRSLSGTLGELRLRGNQLSDAGVSAVLAAVAANVRRGASRLRTLDLADNLAGDSVAPALLKLGRAEGAQLFGRPSPLKVLLLQDNQLGAASCVALLREMLPPQPRGGGGGGGGGKRNRPFAQLARLNLCRNHLTVTDCDVVYLAASRLVEASDADAGGGGGSPPCVVSFAPFQSEDEHTQATYTPYNPLDDVLEALQAVEAGLSPIRSVGVGDDLLQAPAPSSAAGVAAPSRLSNRQHPYSSNAPGVVVSATSPDVSPVDSPFAVSPPTPSDAVGRPTLLQAARLRERLKRQAPLPDAAAAVPAAASSAAAGNDDVVVFHERVSLEDIIRAEAEAAAAVPAAATQRRTKDAAPVAVDDAVDGLGAGGDSFEALQHIVQSFDARRQRAYDLTEEELEGVAEEDDFRVRSLAPSEAPSAAAAAAAPAAAAAAATTAAAPLSYDTSPSQQQQQQTHVKRNLRYSMLDGEEEDDDEAYTAAAATAPNFLGAHAEAAEATARVEEVQQRRDSLGFQSDDWEPDTSPRDAFLSKVATAVATGAPAPAASPPPRGTTVRGGGASTVEALLDKLHRLERRSASAASAASPTASMSPSAVATAAGASVPPTTGKLKLEGLLPIPGVALAGGEGVGERLGRGAFAGVGGPEEEEDEEDYFEDLPDIANISRVTAGGFAASGASGGLGGAGGGGGGGGDAFADKTEGTIDVLQMSDLLRLSELPHSLNTTLNNTQQQQDPQHRSFHALHPSSLSMLDTKSNGNMSMTSDACAGLVPESSAAAQLPQLQQQQQQQQHQQQHQQQQQQQQREETERRLRLQTQQQEEEEAATAAAAAAAAASAAAAAAAQDAEQRVLEQQRQHLEALRLREEEQQRAEQQLLLKQQQVHEESLLLEQQRQQHQQWMHQHQLPQQQHQPRQPDSVTGGDDAVPAASASYDAEAFPSHTLPQHAVSSLQFCTPEGAAEPTPAEEWEEEEAAAATAAAAGGAASQPAATAAGRSRPVADLNSQQAVQASDAGDSEAIMVFSQAGGPPDDALSGGRHLSPLSAPLSKATSPHETATAADTPAQQPFAMSEVSPLPSPLLHVDLPGPSPPASGLRGRTPSPFVHLATPSSSSLDGTAAAAAAAAAAEEAAAVVAAAEAEKEVEAEVMETPVRVVGQHSHSPMSADSPLETISPTTASPFTCERRRGGGGGGGAGGDIDDDDVVAAFAEADAAAQAAASPFVDVQDAGDDDSSEGAAVVVAGIGAAGEEEIAAVKGSSAGDAVAASSVDAAARVEGPSPSSGSDAAAVAAAGASVERPLDHEHHHQASFESLTADEFGDASNVVEQPDAADDSASPPIAFEFEPAPHEARQKERESVEPDTARVRSGSAASAASASAAAATATATAALIEAAEAAADAAHTDTSEEEDDEEGLGTPLIAPNRMLPHVDAAAAAKSAAASFCVIAIDGLPPLLPRPSPVDIPGAAAGPGAAPPPPPQDDEASVLSASLNASGVSLLGAAAASAERPGGRPSSPRAGRVPDFLAGPLLPPTFSEAALPACSVPAPTQAELDAHPRSLVMCIEGLPPLQPATEEHRVRSPDGDVFSDADVRLQERSRAATPPPQPASTAELPPRHPSTGPPPATASSSAAATPAHEPAQAPQQPADEATLQREWIEVKARQQDAQLAAKAAGMLRSQKVERVKGDRAVVVAGCFLRPSGPNSVKVVVEQSRFVVVKEKKHIRKSRILHCIPVLFTAPPQSLVHSKDGDLLIWDWTVAQKAEESGGGGATAAASPSGGRGWVTLQTPSAKIAEQACKLLVRLLTEAINLRASKIHAEFQQMAAQPSEPRPLVTNN